MIFGEEGALACRGGAMRREAGFPAEKASSLYKMGREIRQYFSRAGSGLGAAAMSVREAPAKREVCAPLSEQVTWAGKALEQLNKSPKGAAPV